MQGASLESNPQAFVPKDARGIIRVSNNITWTNGDSVMHSLTSDSDYVDPVKGKFDSTDHMGTLIGQNQTFSFKFVKVGKYYYQCSPHPYMQGVVEIVDNYT